MTVAQLPKPFPKNARFVLTDSHFSDTDSGSQVILKHKWDLEMYMGHWKFGTAGCIGLWVLGNSDLAETQIGFEKWGKWLKVQIPVGQCFATDHDPGVEPNKPCQ